MKDQSRDIVKHDSQDNSPKVWGEKDQDFNSFNHDGHELCRQHQGGQASQPKRIPGTNGEGGDELGLGRRGTNRQAALDFLKKLARRLELLEQKHTKYVAEHRSRLIARLNENEEFALEVQPEIQSLKEDIEKLMGVLGASESEAVTE